MLRVSEGAWVIAGQAAAALGTVIGVRILTEVLQPDTFGTVSLCIGVAALLTSVACTPFAQAAIHLYPEFASTGSEPTLRHIVFREVRRAVPTVVVALSAVALALGIVGSAWWSTVAWIAALFACDCWRCLNLSFLNAARAHRPYGLWMAGDIWARPLIAALLVLTIDESANLVLAAYVLSSILLSVMFRPERAALPDTRSDTNLLRQRVWRYALPLAPLGFIGWANGLSDRYIVGGMLSLADAGIYAAAYGLASRPMLIVNLTVEQALRPLYQEAVTAGRRGRADRILLTWLLVVLAATGFVLACFVFAGDLIAVLLLGEEFRRGAELMPWIAFGYALLCVSYVFERICYAHADTRRVLAIQTCTAVAAIVTTIVAIRHWGLLGAAKATPMYFSVQLVASMLFAYRTRRLRASSDMQPAPA